MNLRYKTKQRENILQYLKENKENHITADNIISYFKSIENPIGKATVYRTLDALLKENMIRKFISEEHESACFQYVEEGTECSNHYHMKCLECGSLFHLNCEEMEEMSNHIFEDHKFKIDIFKTVLYGYCQNCIEKGDLE